MDARSTELAAFVPAAERLRIECHYPDMKALSVAAECSPVCLSHRARLERAARQNAQFIWRCLRRFGVRPDHAVDDALQRVFEVAASKPDKIAAGHERAFLFKTAVLVATECRRHAAQAREIADEQSLLQVRDPKRGPDELLQQSRWRVVLDQLLDSLGLDLRTVFVLYEIEGLSMAEIAELLEVRPGTVASRLRRGREIFHAAAERLRLELQAEGGEP